MCGGNYNLKISNSCRLVTVSDIISGIRTYRKAYIAPHMVSLFILVERVTSARLLPLVFARIILCIVIVQGLQYITLLTVLVFIHRRPKS